MVFAVLALLASAPGGNAPVTIARLPAKECPVPSPDDGEMIGDRAIIADDGSRMVVQCGDGTVRFWQSGAAAFTLLGKMPLFRAAREQGILPVDMLCPWPSPVRDDMETEADCDVIDHDNTGKTYVLGDPAGTDFYVVAGPKILRDSTSWQRFGPFRPGDDRRLQIYLIDGEKRPEALQIMTLDGRSSTMVRLPSPSLVFEDAEGRASDIVYSPAYTSVIVSFGGAFRVAEEMTYLRAFDDNGKERWTIRAKLPARVADQSINGDFARVMGFAGGRYALFAKTSDRSKTQVIDLKDGKGAMTVDGWPIVAARDAAIILTRDKEGSLSLDRLDLSTRDMATGTLTGR